MSYNKFNTRNNSGRYNNTGQFVSAGKLGARLLQNAAQYYSSPQQKFNRKPINTQQHNLQNTQQTEQQATQETRHQQLPLLSSQPSLSMHPQTDEANDEDEIMKEESDGQSKDATRPPWMKSKLPGVKKLSNKERRRRQNESLRRLITPKNALMVLNEMMPNEQIASQFKVDVDQLYQHMSPKFRADLVLDGTSYQGVGESKMSARNAAAEQAIRDLVIKRMSRAEVTTPSGEEPLPMLQLASYALHKLFSEWEQEGHKVPQMKALSGAGSTGVPEEADVKMKPISAPAAPRVLPSNAADMHPCMLLTYMRPRLEYRELGAEGDRPQSMVYTFGVDVDGTTFIGRASNKKEARKAAAIAACADLFGVTFSETPTATRPIHE